MLHVLSIQRTRWARPELVLTLDGTIPEHYQYVKLAWIALLLLMLGWFGRRWAYVPWAGLFAYIVADDFFALHEGVGGWIDARTEATRVVGVPVQALGEVALPGAVTLLLAPLLLWSVLRGPPHDRRVLRSVAVFVALFAGFGVGVDLLHAAFPGGGQAWKIWGVLEEGGELVVASLLLAYLFSVLTQPAERWVRPQSSH